MVRNLVVVLLFTSSLLSAQEAPAPTPREKFDKVQTLVAEGHVFTPTEVDALESLEQQLADEADLASQIHLLRLALATRAAATIASRQARAQLPDNESRWLKQEQFVKNQELWRLTRDIGLWSLTVSTVVCLGLTATMDRLDNGYSSSNEDVKVAIRWSLAGSVSVAFLSLFPLTWGETRQ